MIRVTLTPDQRDAVQALRRDRSLTPHERDWVEMVCLADAGWSPPKIAQHLGYCTATVRRLLTRFRSHGVTALRRRTPGPGPHLARRQQIEATLRSLLAQERTWTAAQLVAALADQGITLGPRQLRRYLHRMGARYRRTVRTLAHQQDPAQVAQAKATLDALKKRQR